jgi:hypothetical protein
MIDGITVRVLGDFGPFSRMGKSIGYHVKIGQSSYLIDCGSPLFQQIGGHGLKTISGLIITHCHDDHKRWFSDFALFNMYAPDIPHKIFLVTAHAINEELRKGSAPALDRSLSIDSKRVINIAYEEYIDYKIIGPHPKYRVATKDEGDGRSRIYVSDRDGNAVGPDKAKIFISPKTGRPRMLFKDPNYEEWIEPESFYPFSSDIFYERNQNVYIDHDEGFTIEAINAPVWHGIPGIGLKFKTDKETLVFSSDTVNNIDIWKQLYKEKMPEKFSISKKEFKSATVIYGEINDYIERIWSEERFREAITAFDNAIVIHDISSRNSTVHTDYHKLGNTALKRDKTILTHSPDKMTSEWVLSRTDKKLRIIGNSFFEIVGDELYPLNADVYHKEEGRYFVGYKNKEGKYAVYDRDGYLTISYRGRPELGDELYSIDLYEDIGGRYFPRLEKSDTLYHERVDGRIELIEVTHEGSVGNIVESCRGKLAHEVLEQEVS